MTPCWAEGEGPGGGAQLDAFPGSLAPTVLRRIDTHLILIVAIVLTAKSANSQEVKLNVMCLFCFAWGIVFVSLFLFSDLKHVETDQVFGGVILVGQAITIAWTGAECSMTFVYRAATYLALPLFWAINQFANLVSKFCDASFVQFEAPAQVPNSRVEAKEEVEFSCSCLQVCVHSWAAMHSW